VKHKIRPIAIHLPQFHTIPENDEWWGKGFTEWTNVKKATPQFYGHYQPHVPLNDNYYDLSVNRVLCDQAEMAKEYGIHGFCFYHYWFNGKKLLEKPLEQMLELGKPDFPFMLCWANENWTRRWDGGNGEILREQNYSLRDDKEHFEYFLPFFKDKRYIKVDGKPVLLIYRSELFPDINETALLWRKMALDSDLSGLYLVLVESFIKNKNPLESGIDASMDFHPSFVNVPDRIEPKSVLKRIFRRNGKTQPERDIYSYKEYVQKQIDTDSQTAYKRYPSIMPGWDNTARRKEKGWVFHNSSPRIYGKWMKYILNTFKPYSKEENFIFINAWNEWAEGNHLEPCIKWGNEYLRKTRSLLKHNID
jgi:lipopolysaccharide biosynthesis protein